jgi:hypothetical protein
MDKEQKLELDNIKSIEREISRRIAILEGRQQEIQELLWDMSGKLNVVNANVEHIISGRMKLGSSVTIGGLAGGLFGAIASWVAQHGWPW